jgi:hypothetical protein
MRSIIAPVRDADRRSVALPSANMAHPGRRKRHGPKRSGCWPKSPPGDPARARQDERDALTFGEMIDLYLAEGAGHKKVSTLKADRGRIERHLRPLLGKLRADRIGRAEIERMRNAVTAGKTAKKVGDGTKRRAGSIATGGKGAAANASRSSVRSMPSPSGAGCALATRRLVSRRRPYARLNGFCPKPKSRGWRTPLIWKLGNRATPIRQRRSSCCC